MPSPLYLRFYAVIAAIPPGRVATYGQIAALAGLPRHSRHVGFALRALPEDTAIPWFRVLNSRGEVAPREGPGYEAGLQRHLLEEEGVEFDLLTARVNLERFGWDPDLTAKPKPTRRTRR